MLGQDSVANTSVKDTQDMVLLTHIANHSHIGSMNAIEIVLFNIHGSDIDGPGVTSSLEGTMPDRLERSFAERNIFEVLVMKFAPPPSCYIVSEFVVEVVPSLIEGNY